MIKRPAEVIGTTAVSLIVTAPILVALWLTLWRPQYEWLGTILPLVIVLGAPVAMGVTGSAGPKLGRRVSEFFTRDQRERRMSPPSIPTGESNDAAQVLINKSVTTTPPTGRLSLSGSAPNVLLISASDDVTVKVQGALYDCNVKVALSSAEALNRINADVPRAIFVDIAMGESAGVEVLQAIHNLRRRNLTDLEHVYLVVSQLHTPDAEWVKLLRRMSEVKVIGVEDLPELAAHFRERR